MDQVALPTSGFEKIGEVIVVPRNLIRPFPTQPREYFDQEKLHQLAAGIKSIGQQVPGQVIKIEGNHYNHIPFLKEIKHTTFEGLTDFGGDIKRFDFVIKTKVKTYLIETNFYNGGGSKLNETARSYSEIGPKINRCPGFEFVWITDGKGWLSAKNKLQEAYSIIPSVYNLTTLEKFLEKVKNEGFPN